MIGLGAGVQRPVWIIVAGFIAGGFNYQVQQVSAATPHVS